MTETVAEVLVEVLNVKPRADETAEAFAERLAKKANDISDVAWEGLTEDAQRWVNTALEAIEAKKVCPTLPGAEAVLPAAQEQDVAPAKTAKKKKAKAKAAKLAKPAVEGQPRGPKGKFALGDKITVTAEANPFREGTKCFGWFAPIKSGMTVKEAIEAGTTRAHIRYNLRLGNLTVSQS